MTYSLDGAKLPNPLRIAVLGSDHAAFAHAADLSLRGFEVRLFELPDLAGTLADAQRLDGVESQPQPSTGLASGFDRRAGVATPIATALIDLGNVLLARDFRREGLSLERIGLGGLTVEQLRFYLETGAKQG